MIAIPYIGIPIAALCCYALLLLALLAAQKDKAIRAFINLLIICFLWTGGSMLMRLQIWPGYSFWYDVSILALFAITYGMYNFVYCFVEAKGTFQKNLWFTLTGISMVLCYFEVFLARPQFVLTGDGQGVFLYNVTWKVIPPSVLFLVMLGSAGKLVWDAVKKNEMYAVWVSPIFIGMLVLFGGNMLSLWPGNIFPWDTLSGIFFAGFLFYALYRKRLFRLRLLVSRNILMGASAVLVSVLFVYWINPLEELIHRYLPDFGNYDSILISLLYASATLILYNLLRQVIDRLFIKEEIVQAERLREFSSHVSQTLHLQGILEELMNVVTTTLEVDRAFVCLYDPGADAFVTAGTANPLDSKNLTLRADNPCISWLREHDACLLTSEFRRTTWYRSMWEEEKRQFTDYKIACMVPLKCDSELVGVLLLAERPGRNRSYSNEDITFLDSVESIVTIAIKNANLYETVYREARTDSLTGLLNRKYFFEQLERELTSCKNASLALLILNLDDFKLFNQLYGNWEGDLMLQKIARIIETTIQKDCTAARYGGKEFAVILPKRDPVEAMQIGDEIRRKVTEMSQGDRKEVMRTITLSGGVCVYPYAAANVKQLTTNADMAVYNAKRSGKNKILLYRMENSGPIENTSADLNLEKVGKNGYQEYASTIYALTAAIDAKDHYTFSHCQKVAEYAAALAREIGLNEQHVQITYEAGLLHDIGKIGIPESILTKKGRLDDEEYRVMQSHVENSVSIIRHLPSLDYVIPAVVTHHERWDGKGYPRGLAGEDIPISGRCLAVADAFDAMTSVRSYKPALSVEFAVGELEKQSGLQFDPQLAPVFVRMVREGKVTLSHDSLDTIYIPDNR